MASQKRMFRVPIIPPLVLALFLFMVAWLFAGCGSKEPPREEKQSLVSLENLQTAYAGSLKRVKMYESFLPRARKEKLRGVASLYRALGRSEAVHAALHAALLRKHSLEPAPVTYDSIVIGSAMQTVKMALSFEELESSSMYPNLARTAGLENFQEGSDQFTLINAVEERHVELLREAEQKVGNIGTTYLVCPGCGYIVTSKQTEECPVCKAAKKTFESI